MKTLRIAVTLCFVFVACAAFAGSAAQTSFDELKSLNGSWEGKTASGEPVLIDYRVTSNGSALMSEIKGKEDMISMFNLDGGRLLLTHYCSAGNQPRMVASASPDGKTITFDFLDATNLASPDAGHMDRVVVSILDANHHTEEWTYNDHGKEMKEAFDLWRKK
jgi:YD repeat-containing protein